MKLTITNIGAVSTAILGASVSTSLDPQESVDIDTPDTVLVYGDKPGVREQFATAFERLKQLFNREVPENTSIVQASIANHGSESVRLILGDGTTDETLEAGQSFNFMAPVYIEMRELGNAPQQGGTPD